MEHILSDKNLTSVVSFHAEQAIEKSFKALLANNQMDIPKTHDIRRLHKMIGDNISLDERQIDTLLKINELYIDSRYPGVLVCCHMDHHHKKMLENFTTYLEQSLRLFVFC
jgi:HEPN domain-containing protein